MTADPNRPEKLLSVRTEIEATAIVTALAEYDVEAFAAGGYTAGFRAEAPGYVTVLVKHADLDRAKQAVAEIRRQQGDFDWSKVDVTETAEAQPPADEDRCDDPDWRPVTRRLWWTVELLGTVLCFVIWLFTRELTPLLLYAVLVIALMAIVAAVFGMCRRLRQHPDPGVGSEVHPRRLSDAFSSAILFGMVVQIVFLLLTALLLDGGVMFRMCLTTAVGYWIGVGIIAVRRGASPTKLDLLFTRYGMVGLMVVAPFLAKLVYIIIGESDLSGLERLFGRR